MKIDCDIEINKNDKILYPIFSEDLLLTRNYISSRILGNNNTKSKAKLPGTIWAITSFFNPANYANKYKNYKLFRENSLKQGLKLLTIELSFNKNNDYEIKNNDADKVIRVIGGEDNILWQKEPLLNIALKELPDDCDKVIWIDCDLIFHNDHWVAETAQKLEDYVVVQPFSSVVRLPQGYLSSSKFLNLDSGSSDRQYMHSLARGVHYCGKDILNYNYLTEGHVGLVWAIRRKVIEKVGGFFEYIITGANDTAISYAFYGLDLLNKINHIPTSLVTSITDWKNQMYKEVFDSVTYTDGIVDHLWHGTIENRNFDLREKILYDNDYDPFIDIGKSENGLLKWTTKKTALRNAIQNYFHERKEEG